MIRRFLSLTSRMIFEFEQTKGSTHSAVMTYMYPFQQREYIQKYGLCLPYDFEGSSDYLEIVDEDV